MKQEVQWKYYSSFHVDVKTCDVWENISIVCHTHLQRKPPFHTMVLIFAQTTAFFENEDQMGIPHATVVQLATEGTTSVIDLADFDKDSLQQLADNLRRPGRVPDPNPAAQPGTTIATPSFILGNPSSGSL
jgi:hypothetical protein